MAEDSRGYASILKGRFSRIADVLLSATACEQPLDCHSEPASKCAGFFVWCKCATDAVAQCLTAVKGVLTRRESNHRGSLYLLKQLLSWLLTGGSRYIDEHQPNPRPMNALFGRGRSGRSRDPPRTVKNQNPTKAPHFPTET